MNARPQFTQADYLKDIAWHRQQISNLLRKAYPQYAHLDWMTVTVNEQDIDVQYEINDDQSAEVRAAFIYGELSEKLVERLELQDLVQNEYDRGGRS